MDIVQTQAQEVAALSAKIEALTDAVRMLYDSGPGHHTIKKGSPTDCLF